VDNTSEEKKEELAFSKGKNPTKGDGNTQMLGKQQERSLL
jgi:hypothetical protein